MNHIPSQHAGSASPLYFHASESFLPTPERESPASTWSTQSRHHDRVHRLLPLEQSNQHRSFPESQSYGRAVLTHEPVTAADTLAYMVLPGVENPISVPIDYSQGSKKADEKRQQNAKASVRHRRKKRQQKTNDQQQIEVLQMEIRQLQDDVAALKRELSQRGIPIPPSHSTTISDVTVDSVEEKESSLPAFRIEHPEQAVLGDVADSHGESPIQHIDRCSIRSILSS